MQKVVFLDIMKCTRIEVKVNGLVTVIPNALQTPHFISFSAELNWFCPMLPLNLWLIFQDRLLPKNEA